MEAGEQFGDALVRELREELAIEARIGAELGRYDIRYGNGPVMRLMFFQVTEFTGEPVNLEFERMVWEERGKLFDYDFLDGDVEFVRKLAGG